MYGMQISGATESTTDRFDSLGSDLKFYDNTESYTV